MFIVNSAMQSERRLSQRSTAGRCSSWYDKFDSRGTRKGTKKSKIKNCISSVAASENPPVTMSTDKFQSSVAAYYANRVTSAMALLLFTQLTPLIKVYLNKWN